LIIIITVYFFRAQQLDPNDHLVHYYIAFYYACLAKVPEATIKVRQALSLNPEHTPSLQLAILLLSAQKKINEAKALLESSLEDFPDHIGLLFIRARIELQIEASDVTKIIVFGYK
jgi:tetratricopeptide (TPR) repeat protein